MKTEIQVGDRVLYVWNGAMALSGRVVEVANDYVRVTDESLTLYSPQLPFVGSIRPIEHYRWIPKDRIIERLAGREP